MPGIFSDTFSHMKNYWRSISLSHRVFIGTLALVLVATFFGLVLWINNPDYQTLYTNLGPEDANRVVKSLESQKIPFKLTHDGATVQVPADKVYQLRVKIAGEGMLTGSGVGFEFFSEAKFGQTDFVQKVNYQRALQGELARTISAFPAVENARVHLVMPHRSLFIEDQQKPSASVVIQLAPGRKMEGKEVQAIVNLLTMSIEGLDKNRVSIADSAGKVLYQPQEENPMQLSSTQLEHKNNTQASLERRIEELLMPIIGAGRVIAKVNVDMDYSQKTISKELYDPDKTVLRSEQRSEESTQGRANLESGVPDTNFRGDGLGGTTSTQSSNRETRSSNFEINKEVQNIVSQVGGVNRLSVAVVVDGVYTKDATGAQVFAPRTDDEIKRIRQLVANAVGFDSARGDTIEVTSIAFTTLEEAPDKNLAEMLTDYALRIGKPLLNALLVFLFLIMVVRPVVLALIRPKVQGEMIEGLEGLPSGEDRLALVGDDDEAAEAMATLEKIEDIKAHTIQLSEQNMEQALGIIRSWLKEPEKAKA